ncbi:MAG: hypothetical protein QXO76_05390, partial [Thermoproteota archaeon]
SKEKDSCKRVAGLASKMGAPFEEELLAELIKASVRGGELKLVKSRNRFYLDQNNLSEWLKQRVIPSTVYLSKDDYTRALAQGFRLAILRAGVIVDFDRARKRDFGQRWSDYTRGELGEIGFKHFLEERFGKKVRLEKRIEARPEDFYARDVSAVEEEGSWREPHLKLSIKSTKLGGEWLDLPGAQLERSDAFVLVKAGLTLDHIASFLKDWGLLEKLFRYAQTLGEPGFEEEEIKKIFERIPALGDVPVYICGFAYKADFEQNNFELRPRRKREKILNEVVRGIGSLSSIDGEFEVLGIPAMTKDHRIASSGYLKWRLEDWKELINKL